ncbi:MAG: hypothetical protein EOP09_00345 [Proteobacteria bacterium]|nr:MAG: hypothetical protein EOP09_00345 [Pseudomonadota bacterium]
MVALMFRSLVAPVLKCAAVAAAFLSLVSCHLSAPVPPEFWSDKNAKVAVAVSVRDGAKFIHRTGGGDFPARNHAAAGALGRVKADDFRATRGKFAAELRKRGFRNVEEVKGDIDWRGFPPVGHNQLMAGRDYSSLMAARNADYLVILSLNEYGVTQRALGSVIVGTVGVAAPWGSAQTTGVMVRRGGGKAVWFTGPVAGMQSTEVEENWNQAPNYPALVKAVHEVQKVSGEFLIHEFFGYPEE